MISIIAAVTRDMGLGKGDELLYRLSDDMKHFKSLTMGHAIVMGRKTFESFPKGPLPGRRNIVISRNPEYKADGAEIYMSLADAIEAAHGDCYVIGGGSVYREAMEMADELYMTLIDAPSPDGTDTYFSSIDLTQWQPVEIAPEATDSRTGIPYRFARFIRK